MVTAFGSLMVRLFISVRPLMFVDWLDAPVEEKITSGSEINYKGGWHTNSKWIPYRMYLLDQFMPPHELFCFPVQ